jgi:hypothetical protein
MFCPQSYTIIAAFFPKLLGFVYLIALGALLFQIKGLIGENGILPLAHYLNIFQRYPWHLRLRYAPTLFWFNASNRALITAIVAGLLCALCLISGIYPSLMLLLLYVIYLSLVTAGQDFLSFGWEGLMLEITIQTFLMSLTIVPNLMVWISLNFLLFRFHFQAGLIKLQSLDPSWRNLTAIAHHYQSQPLPNTIAWYAHRLPLWFQKLSTCWVFILELILPFGIFLNESIRLGVFGGFFSLQFLIWLTGNFSYLNFLTAAFATILISNTYLEPWTSLPALEAPSTIFNVILSLLGAVFLGLQLLRLWNHIFPQPKLNQLFSQITPFHLVNRYTLFANMTIERFEVVIEGSNDGQSWKEYTFKYKPSEVTRRPRRIAPYQPRLDWQAWFLPFRDFYSEPWFQSFLMHILKGTPEVLKLLRDNPFAEHPPKYIRSLLYEYKFSTLQEKREKGVWWQRQELSLYSPSMSLKKK